MEASEELFFRQYPFLVELIAGGCCGLAVDSFLFPIDTCKTRLQSESGFWKSGGFRGIYNGIVPVISASVPIAALFFVVYYTANICLPPLTNDIIPGTFVYTRNDGWIPTTESTAMSFFIRFLLNSCAASFGEMCAALIRVPIEIVKQNRQVSKVQYRAIDILLQAYRSDGLVNGVYRGYGVTIMRDIPFSMIQYPLWELLKSLTAPKLSGNLKIFVDSCHGSVAGAVASGITTPLDVAKTRIQLAEVEDFSSPECGVGGGDAAGINGNVVVVGGSGGGGATHSGQTQNPIRVLRLIYRQKGIAGVFSGFVPRVLWTTIGGFIYFGTYSFVKYILERI